jgi:CDP-6-deoxy-D-xylo-4-hexulose-3-dehydrase
MLEAMMRPSSGRPHLVPGDKVLVPAIAWPTTIWPVIQLGLKPVFVDIDEKTLAIDLEAAKTLIARDRAIRAMFIIHPMGRTIDKEELEEFETFLGIRVINDVCESLGSFFKDSHAGSNGLASSYSFYFSHHLTTMEGGGISTNDDSIADDLRSIRSHGWSRDRSDAAQWHNNLQGNDAKFLFVTTGFNIRPMEIQAAIGRSQLPDLDSFIEKRRNIAKRVHQAIEGTIFTLIGSDTLIDPKRNSSHSWMLLPILINSELGPKVKQQVIEFLESLEIETRPVLTGNFLSQPSMRRIGSDLPDPSHFPVANKISQNAFLVGAHHDLEDSQIDFLCDAIHKSSKLVKK